MRKFKLIVEPPITQKGFCGVYYLNVGFCFYIGRSVDIMRRAKQHKYEIEKLFKLYGHDRTLIPDYHYKFKVFNYLFDNPWVDTLGVNVIEKCDPENIMTVEEKWLEEAAFFPECLNVGFTAKPSSHDTRVLNIAKASGHE